MIAAYNGGELIWYENIITKAAVCISISGNFISVSILWYDDISTNQQYMYIGISGNFISVSVSMVSVLVIQTIFYAGI